MTRTVGICVANLRAGMVSKPLDPGVYYVYCTLVESFVRPWRIGWDFPECPWVEYQVPPARSWNVWFGVSTGALVTLVMCVLSWATAAAFWILWWFARETILIVCEEHVTGHQFCLGRYEEMLKGEKMALAPLHYIYIYSNTYRL